METMTECLPPISDHPDLTGQARRKRRDSLGVVSWTVRGRTVCLTPGALLRLGSGPSSRTSKTRRTAPQKQVGSAKKSKLGVDQSKKKQVHRHRTETFHPGDPASTDRQSRIDKSAIPPIPLRRNGGWWCGRIQWCGEISM